MIRTAYGHRETMYGEDGYRFSTIEAGDTTAALTAWSKDGRIDLEIRDAAAGISLLRATFYPEIPGGRFIIEAARPGVSIER